MIENSKSGYLSGVTEGRHFVITVLLQYVFFQSTVGNDCRYLYVSLHHVLDNCSNLFNASILIR